ncbi:MAG: hypothetical protein MRY83_14145 [Flavobacteriales bacterium]|nr:hypothetical protein [Flavobacteriales bacterium]
MNKTALNKEEFRVLDIHDKMHLLYTKGDFVSYRIFQNQKIKLYAIFGFFVELWYDRKNYRISRISLVSRDIVELLYLDKISLKVS